MPDKRFKVDIFEVEPDPGPSLEDAIDRVIGTDLTRRTRVINRRTRRLEDEGYEGRNYLLNFTTFNFDGPGRVSQAQRAAAFRLRPDESFAVSTTMLYDSRNSLAFIEAMRGGMGPTSIAKYLASFMGPEVHYEMDPRLDANAAAKLRTAGQLRKIELRVATGPVGRLDRDRGVGAIRAFGELGEEIGAGRISLTMDVGQRQRGAGLLLDPAKRLARSFMGEDTRNVEQLRVYLKDDPDEPVEMIDLIQHRERRELLLPINLGSRQVEHETRWEALLDIRRDFLRDVP